METLFAELKRYVGWSAADEAALRALSPHAAPELERIAVVFYDRILEHSEAKKALEGGESQVGRLKITLKAWMESLLVGPWDEAYYERRARIGRVHVRIALPQHYMFGAMDVVRLELASVIEHACGDDRELRRATSTAITKVLDLELAIMLHTYREDLLAHQLATIGTLTAGLSHEIKNPLNAASLQLRVLETRLRNVPEAQRQEYVQPLHLVQEEIVRLDGLLLEFLDFARPRRLAIEHIDLARLLGRVLELLMPEAARGEVTLERAWQAPLEIEGDEQRIHQVVVNLVRNAIQATPPGGRVIVEASSNAQGLRLAVEDSGSGVPPEMRAQVFEPFFTTKPAGTGLGLPVVHSVVEQHGGSIRVERGALGGARFEVSLPAR